MLNSVAVDGFLSTPSGWRATPSSTRDCLSLKNFYPRPPGGGRRLLKKVVLLRRFISIHALRVEGDISTSRYGSSAELISIHALRVEGDGRLAWAWEKKVTISIHALRVEGDHPSGGRCSPKSYFYPRPPGGGRLQQRVRFRCA